MNEKNALILVDLQNDFCPGGQLAVPDGQAIIPLANQLQQYFHLVVATQDWHPANHISFAANHAGAQVGDIIDVNGVSQVLWPAHCIQFSNGAAFHPQLNTQKVSHIIQKGIDPLIDSYSGFFDNAHLRATGLAEYLHDNKIETVFVLGLATDYCVKYTALDAVQLGFRVLLIADACRGVGIQEDDISKAITEMQAAGVIIIGAQDVPQLSA